jgi:hypothetical protein
MTAQSSVRWLAVALPIATLAAPTRAEGPPLEFNRHVRPILADACFACHGPDKAKRKADLRLDTEAGAFADLGGTKVLAPGKPSESELYRRITAEDAAERMPPARSHRSLKPSEIDLLRRWIEQGAKYQQHWAFIPPARPPLPDVSNPAWVRNPIDAFILARLDAERLSPSPEAPKATLIRRASLDLTGLPPTPEEVDAFERDPSPDAYAKVVDRLLATPRYGERMALDWLDAARYADTNGYQSDRTRTMWPWRDQLIDALNSNQPFDRYTVEQLAGDLLPGATPEQVLASGFHRNHMLNGEGGRVAEESRVDYVVDRVDTTATVWLGLTLACARCHDHKFDPFSQREYYQLFAYFNNVPESGGIDSDGQAAPTLNLATPEQSRQLAEQTKRFNELDRQWRAAAKDRLPVAQKRFDEGVRQLDKLRQAIDPLLKSLNRYVSASYPAERDNYRKQLAELERRSDEVTKALRDIRGELDELQKLEDERNAAAATLDQLRAVIPRVMVMQERPQPRETHVLVRGAWDKKGERVGPGVPGLLGPLPADVPPNRLGLARWLVNPEHPLTARVAVNRAWQQFFGTGLVKTAEDFGVQGETPSHPELLDWLATEFVRGGWDVKRLHRLIVTSATYRQSSRLMPALRERDPDNRLLARGPRHRLDAFALRDQALFVSGLLVERRGGPSVKPYQPPGIWEEMSFGQVKYQQDHGEALYRRSLYTFWRRTVGPPPLFDTTARQVCTVRPSRTNTPLHALTTLNETTYVEAARVLAERLLKECDTLDDRITRLFRLTAARAPTDAERQVLLRASERLRRQYADDRAAAEKLTTVGERPRDRKWDVVELAVTTGLASLVLNLDEVLCKE